MVIAKMRNVTRGLCTLGLALSAGVYAADEAVAAKTTAQSSLEESLVVSRKKLYVEIDAIMNNARNAHKAKDFDGAEKFYQEAKKFLDNKDLTGDIAAEKRKALDVELKTFYRDWANDLMAKARSEGAKERYSEAMALAGRAALLDPSLDKAVERFVAECKARIKSADYKKETGLDAIYPKNKEDNLKKEQLYREGARYFAAGRYEDAKRSFEQVYLIDPFDMKVTDALNQIYQKMINAGSVRRTIDNNLQYIDAGSRWLEPVLPRGASVKTVVESEVKDAKSDSVYNRMEQIIFPKVEFEDADFMTVVRFFNSRSRSFDPARVGVEIATALDIGVLNSLPKITMSFTNMPMSEALRYLCRQVGLEYRIEGGTVVIGHHFDSMQLQIFSVRGDFISGINAAATAEGSSAGVGETTMGQHGKGGKTEDIFDTSAPRVKSSAPIVSGEALKKYFEDRGVPFPEGSQISYEPMNNKLSVRNRAENLRKLEDLIRQLDKIDTPLVMVEVKIMELAENDWQELGFDWAFSAWQISGSVPDNPGYYYNNQNSAWAAGQSSQPNRNGGGGADGGGMKLLNDFKIFPNFGSEIFGDTQINLSLSINAVSRNTRTEFLSSPKVVTLSGKPAKIKMVKQYYFPETWEAPTVNTNNNFSVVTAPIPTFSSTPTDVGIILDVTPTVSPDNYTVVLDLHPKVAQYISNTDDIVIVDQGEYVNGIPRPYEGYPVEFNVWMPNITSRKMDVVIKVYDGETVVMGGMVDTKHETLDDKWPVLGDIPLLGRLFASQYEKKYRTNMLLFVTARLINNDGVPLRRNLSRAMPDLNR